MEITGKAAVIGDNEGVLAFNALGLDVFIAEDAVYARDMIRRLTNGGYVLIFISEKLAANISDGKNKPRAYPIIIPIPDWHGSTGYGQQLLKNNIKKAVGTDIIFK